jgi:hypothetical protein
MLSNIAGRCVVLVDDFADQVYSIEAILGLTDKSDLLFLGAERSYRHRFIREVLSGTIVKTLKMKPLSSEEAGQLIDTYFRAGLVGSGSFIDRRPEAILSLKGEPIAVACCRILNDLKPLDRIVESILEAGNKFERDRYITTALAQYCTKGGIRFDLLIAATSSAGVNGQFSEMNPLPLAYSQDRTGNYIVPLNGTLSQRALEIFSSRKTGEIIRIFVDLATAIAPRVNRQTIVQRAPEARLAARLFDFDQVVEPFLGKAAEDFYDAVQAEWQWNSRYWEQVALLNLSKYQALGPSHPEAREALNLAIAHARHAVSIEHHPLTLTTLAKILLSDAAVTSGSVETLFSEAMTSLNNAIAIEQRRDRVSVQPFMVMFRGLQGLPMSIQLKDSELSAARAHLRFAKQRFSKDPDVKMAISGAEERLAR